MTDPAQVIRFPTERRQARRLVPMAELVEHFSFSTRFFRYRIKEGMPAHRFGNRLRFDLAEVEAWLEARNGGGDA